MERRELFKILTVSAAAAETAAAQQQPHHHGAPAKPKPVDRTLKFFTPFEGALVERVADIVIPDDERSPGAAQAGAIFFIDRTVLHSDAETRRRWRDDIARIAELATQRFSQPFDRLTRAQQEQLVAAIAAHEADEAHPLGATFRNLKQAAVLGYHYSPVGLQHDMGYKGNTAVPAFPGCSHPEHQDFD